jgi:CBS domain-containing protein
MKVQDIMTHSAVCCSPDTNVGAAVELMWKHNCGMLPVVGADGKIEGIITDRDICIAMGTRNRLPGSVTAGEIATKKVYTCGPDDEIHEALETMAEQQVHRLPVVDKQGVPQGILSMDDILVHADLNKWEDRCELSSEEVIRSLKRLHGQQFPLAHTRSQFSEASQRHGYDRAHPPEQSVASRASLARA